MKFESIKLDARSALIGNRGMQTLLLCVLTGLILFFSGANLLFNIAAQKLGFGSAAAQTAFAAVTLFAAAALIPPMKVKIQKSFNENAGICCSSARSFAPGNAFAAARLYAMLFMIKTAWLAFYMIIPAGYAAALCMRLLSSPVNERSAVTLIIGLAVLVAVGLGFCLVTVQRYSRACFCLAASPGISARDAIKQSVAGTRGGCLETLLFKLSFFPWFLLCAAVLPVGYVWTYYKQSLTCFYIGR